MVLPDFLVIGVPKAGSTALHSALAQHPQLHLSKVKEPKYWLTDGPPPKRGGPGDAQTYQEYIWRREDYERLFADAPDGTLCGESTPFYLWSGDAQRRIRAEIPDVKMIAMLRDPVERAHSNWTHLWSAGLEPEADFVQACALEPQRIRDAWAPFWRYIELGRYGEQITRLYERFPRDQVLVLRYRELRAAPVATLDRICDFLGIKSGVIDTVPAENVTTHVPHSIGPRLAQTALRAGAGIGHFFPEPVRKLARGPLLTWLHATPRTRVPLTPEQRSAVIRYFADDIMTLSEVTRDDYTDWLNPTRTTTGGYRVGRAG
jgi:hypothetical protein